MCDKHIDTNVNKNLDGNEKRGREKKTRRTYGTETEIIERNFVRDKHDKISCMFKYKYVLQDLNSEDIWEFNKNIYC